MSALQAVDEVKAQAEPRPKVNDFSITVCTVNGSGSQTSNLTILRALFKMGIPVSGKNLFPSNIQGLPTFYMIRVNKDGFLARREEHDIVVAINPASFPSDYQAVEPGGVLLYADDIKYPLNRTDIFAYPMPVKKLVRDAEVPSNLRDYMYNMVYVGVLAQLLGIDLEKIKQAINYHFKGKPKPAELNFSMVQQAHEWASQNLVKKDPFFVEPINATENCMMTDGNTAAALGMIFGGIQFASWYPITPATSLAESLNEYLPLLRKDPVETGKNTFAVIQAEDELAAIGMAVGAGWAGLRAATSTSGPGLSLMTEYMGLAYFAEVPLVLWDVQRVGPSTGLPTRTSQGDLTFVYFMGHGDTNQIILLPGSVKECFEFGWQAFDIAEHFQMPVFLLSDLDFGMNQWMSDAFEYPDMPMDRGKVFWEDDLERIKGQWGRYRDVDGDGIPYRTIPGNRHPAAAYFARGTGHDELARYSEDDKTWHDLLDRLKTKYQGARTVVPAPVIEKMDGSRIGLICYGSTTPAVEEARHQLLQKGIKTDFMRIRSVPFSVEVKEFINAHERNYVVEENRDGQMRQILTIDFPEVATRLYSYAYTDGLPMSAKEVREGILAMEAKSL